MSRTSQLSSDLDDALRAGGAPRMWRRVMADVLPVAGEVAPPGSTVLEVGYGDGLLTCFMARSLGWHVVGLDAAESCWEKATRTVRAQGLQDDVELRLCRPEETRRHRGSYDAVFIKTVLYSSRDDGEYAAWLDWIGSVLRREGHLVNLETGRANAVTQLYRRLRGREYTDLSLYTARQEKLYDARFEMVYRRYYGGVSQFAAPLGALYRLVSRVEERVMPPTANRCFVVAMVARKPPAVAARRPPEA